MSDFNNPLLLLDRCESFIFAAKKLEESTGLYPVAPKLYVIGHAIELLLKAFIFNQCGYDKKYHTHDLKVLYLEAKQNGLEQLPGVTADTITDLDLPWSQVELLIEILNNSYPNGLRYPEHTIDKRWTGWIENYPALAEPDKKHFIPNYKETCIIAESAYEAVLKFCQDNETKTKRTSNANN